MGYQPGIDVVIVNYKTPAYLKKCLMSLRGYPPTVPWGLWVMNVCPDEADTEVAERLTMGINATHADFEENLGYARACNLGASYGEREVVGLFNADVQFFDGTLDACHRALLDHPTWGVLGPLQYDEQGLTTHAGIFGTLRKPVHRAWHAKVRDAYRDVRPAVTVAGSAYFVKRQVWEELTTCPTYQESAPGALGAFLPTPHYFEETFCSYHAQHHGWEVTYYGKAEMIHSWHKSPGPVDHHFKVSQGIFREACDHHKIPHD